MDSEEIKTTLEDIGYNINGGWVDSSRRSGIGSLEPDMVFVRFAGFHNFYRIKQILDFEEDLDISQVPYEERLVLDSQVGEFGEDEQTIRQNIRQELYKTKDHRLKALADRLESMPIFEN